MASNNIYDRIEEMAVWYDYHKREASDVVKRLELQEKFADNVFDLLALVSKELRRLNDLKVTA